MNGPDFNLLAQGGPVMWVLLGLSIVALILFLERALFLHRGQIRSVAFLSGIRNIVAKRRLMEALTVCEETPGPVAAVVKAGLLHYDEDEDRMRAAVREAAIVELPALERRLGSIAAIAQVAPLIGLLGTILGMIKTFYLFNQGGHYAQAGFLAGGMWESLLTTAAGLALAIPAHLGYHFLSGRVRALVHDMEWAGNEIMAFLLKEVRSPGLLEDQEVIHARSSAES
jgi:biopolymer transport protein ExbB